MSLNSNDTYIGSSNNQPNRLNNHNNNDPSIKRKGAKRTRGQTWIPVIIISGFQNKNECLSFEAGWKRLSKKRNNERLYYINEMTNSNLYYTKNTIWNRIMDLIFFVNNFTLIGTHFKLNYDLRHPINQPTKLVIYIFMESWIEEMPWPYFIYTKWPKL